VDVSAGGGVGLYTKAQTLHPEVKMKAMDPFDSIDEILAIVRDAKTPSTGFSRLIDHCSDVAPDPLWSRLPNIDIAGDVAAAVQWLREQLRGRDAATGIYLGLDTLNMNGGRGANVEIGGSGEADPSKTDLEWMYRCSWYGDGHLIRGLLELHHVYAKDEEDLFSFADYVLFLGYSGLVLASAVEGLDLPARAGTKGRLFAWGFHDGDIFPLLRTTLRKTERLALEE
jgi:hypothetical protein